MTDLEKSFHAGYELARKEFVRDAPLMSRRVAELEAEIERLQAALQEIHDFPYVGAQASVKICQIARRALEGK